MKQRKDFYFAMLFIGLFALGVAVFSYKKNTEFYTDADTTIATITNVESDFRGTNRSRRTSRAYAKYTINGKEYANVPIDIVGGMHVGSEVKVYYHLENPYDIRVKQSDNLFVILFGIIGSLFTLGALCGIFGKRKNRR